MLQLLLRDNTTHELSTHMQHLMLAAVTSALAAWKIILAKLRANFP